MLKAKSLIRRSSKLKRKIKTEMIAAEIEGGVYYEIYFLIGFINRI